MEQQAEFDFAKTHARREGPASSRDAAIDVAPRANRQCESLLLILRRGPISNSKLLGEALDVGITNYRARVSDLRRLGCEIEVEHGVYTLTRDVGGA